MNRTAATMDALMIALLANTSREAERIKMTRSHDNKCTREDESYWILNEILLEGNSFVREFFVTLFCWRFLIRGVRT